MSGTSLDGLDIAYCTFEHQPSSWKYHIIRAETIPYSIEWAKRLRSAEKSSAFEFVQTDIDFGHLSGQLTRQFIEKHQLIPDFIASHGHTIFHQPEKKITSQIGCGAAIAAETGIPVVCDFRSIDVALGGQGAPLVPIGDKLLFPDFEFCLNLGGFANISFDDLGQRIAYDVCPVNIVLNDLAAREGYPYDPEGSLARKGSVNPPLLEKLNNLPWYHLDPPKSLGREWVLENIIPLFTSPGLSTFDLLATFCEHIAIQIATVTGKEKHHRVLITGGGAMNQFLTERIRHHVISPIVIPDTLTINFKEALIFAFLGLLRWSNENNCLKSVTGASIDHSGGCIYRPI